jgi:hypothetical protein
MIAKHIMAAIKTARYDDVNVFRGLQIGFGMTTPLLFF